MKTFLCSIVFISISLILFADAGNCILYKAKFELRNGISVEGYFYYSTYGNLKLEFTGPEFNSLVDELFIISEDTLTILSRIQPLAYPKIIDGGMEYRFISVLEKDMIKISWKDFKSAQFIDYLPKIDKNKSGIPLYLDCAANSLISELTQNEIDLLQKPPVSYYYCTPRNKIIEDAYELLSYNPEINESDLILYCDRFKKLDDILKNCKERNLFQCYLSEYSKIKKELAERNIVLFRY